MGFATTSDGGADRRGSGRRGLGHATGHEQFLSAPGSRGGTVSRIRRPVHWWNFRSVPSLKRPTMVVGWNLSGECRLVWAGRQPRVGAQVFATGNPQGLTNTLSQGLVSGLRDIDSSFTVIQSTAAISQGSSGGPLLSAQGKVIGVTTAYLYPQCATALRC